MKAENEKQNRLLCTLCLPLNDVSKTVILEDDDTLTTFCHRNFEKFYFDRFPQLKGNQFILKLPGKPTYLENVDELLRNNPYIAESIHKKEKPELIFVEKVQILFFPSVTPNLGISNRSKSHHLVIFLMSLKMQKIKNSCLTKMILPLTKEQ